MENPVRRTELAAEIRAELARQKRTQVSLSAATGLSLNTLRRRLDGVKPFYVEELEAVCMFLGVPLSDMITRARDAS